MRSLNKLKNWIKSIKTNLKKIILEKEKEHQQIEHIIV